MSPAIITLTSDFGPGVFVGLMKGVILGICPKARLVDLDHNVPPQDVRAGALVLEQALGVFPQGTVHLAVVDPGVGGARKAFVLQAAGCFWVGPDNGLFTPILAHDPEARAWEISDSAVLRSPVSHTFHGRDIFAPAAAHLALGRDPASLGPEVKDPVRLEWPLPRLEKGALTGQVLGADSFGNLGTNLERRAVEDFLSGRVARVRMAGAIVKGLSPSYDAAPPGQVVAVFNSQERLELAVSQGSLLARLGLEPGNERGLEVRVEALD